jgi:hypothetical protein
VDANIEVNRGEMIASQEEMEASQENMKAQADINQ